MRRTGQAPAVGGVILMLVVGAIMYMFLYRPFQQLDDAAGSTLSNGTALQGIDNTMTVFAPGFPLAITLVGALGLVVIGLFSRRR